MLLKRKRSIDELSFSSGGGAGYSPPLRADNGDVVMMDLDNSSPISPCTILSPNRHARSHSGTPAHLPGRTFKRLRNGRPSDEEVHQHTLKILYQAQQQPQKPQHVFSPPASAASTPAMPPSLPALPAPAQNQPSLHSFWKIQTAQPSQSPCSTWSVSSPASAPIIDMVNRPTSCEDCGVGLNEEDAMMDDGYGFETYINTCSACSRAVCFSCSVSNLGEQRRCLFCAGREKSAGKKWFGGVGWSSGGVTVC